MSGGYKIECVVAQPLVEPVGLALDAFAFAIAAFEIVPDGAWRVEAYSADAPDPAAVEGALAAALGAARPAIAITALPVVDWLAENRRSFPVQRLGRFWVYGSHIAERPPVGVVPIRIDAATAFGSGEHPTTRLCLAAIEAVSRRRRVRRPLDIGCGSGILAIALAKHLRCPVVASDLDPEAARVARANAGPNGVAAALRIGRAAGFDARLVRRNRPYDLVVANILAKPLIRLAPALRRHLAPGGTAIVSGLLTVQETMVVAAHTAVGLAVEKRLRRDGWSALILRRRP